MASNSDSNHWWPPQSKPSTQEFWQNSCNSNVAPSPSQGPLPPPIRMNNPHSSVQIAPPHPLSNSHANLQPHSYPSVPNIQTTHPPVPNMQTPYPNAPNNSQTSYHSINMQLPYSLPPNSTPASYLSSPSNVYPSYVSASSSMHTTYLATSNNVVSAPNNVQVSCTPPKSHLSASHIQMPAPNMQASCSQVPNTPISAYSLVPHTLQPPVQTHHSVPPPPGNLHQVVQPSHSSLPSSNLQHVGQLPHPLPLPPNNLQKPLQLSHPLPLPPSNLQQPVQLSHPHVPNSFQPAAHSSCQPPPNNLHQAAQLSHPIPPPQNSLQQAVQSSLTLSIPPNNFQQTVPSPYSHATNNLQTAQVSNPHAPNSLLPPAPVPSQIFSQPLPHLSCPQVPNATHNYQPPQENQVSVACTVSEKLQQQPPPPETANAVLSSLSTPIPMMTSSVFPTPGHCPQQQSVPMTYVATMPCVQTLPKEESDKKWLEDWLASKVKKSPVSEENNDFTVFTFRSLVKGAYFFISELDKTKASLDVLVSLDANHDVWKKKLNEAVRLMEKLRSIKKLIFHQYAIDKILTKLKKIKKKRNYIRRRREERKQEKRESEQERAEYIRYLNRMQEQLKEKDLQTIRENELKKEADDILSEVRKKIQETKKIQEKIRILEKLRQIRKENSQKKGLHVSTDSDDNFKKKVTNLKELMHKQLLDYSAEEKALQVMLETEQEGQREREAARRLERLQQLLEEKQSNIEECLFGDADIPPPLVFFWQHYNQAAHSIENLLHIRHQWDIFLVPPNSSKGSTIPPQWVTPDPPGDEVWASALEKN